MSVIAGGHFWAQIKNTKHCHVQGFLCNVKFIGLHKNVQALFGLLKDKLKCLLHLFKKKKKTWTRRDQKRKKSQLYSHSAHENTCKCEKFNDKFKLLPTEDETFYG